MSCCFLDLTRKGTFWAWEPFYRNYLQNPQVTRRDLGLDKKRDILSLRNFLQKLSKESSSNEKRSKKCHCYMKFWKMVKWKNALNSKKVRKLYQRCERCSFDGCTLMMKSRVLFLSERPREVEHERWILSIGIAKTMNSWWHLAWPISSTKTFHLAFTLQRYVEKCKMSRVRLYLTSKINILDDVSLLKPADHKPSSTSKLERKECCLNGDETKSQTLSKLEERRKIISEQDAAYEEPLATDKAKREKLMKEVKLWSVKQ